MLSLPELAHVTLVRYRFWSADWAPGAIAALRSRWLAMMFQLSARAVSE